MNRKYRIGWFAGLLLVCRAWFSVFGAETDLEIYGTSAQAPVYSSVEELQSAAYSQLESWTSGLGEYYLTNFEDGVMISAYDESKYMYFSYDDGVKSAVGMLEFRANGGEQLNIDEIEQAVNFSSTLLSGESGRIGEDVRQCVTSAMKGASDNTQLLYGFKRVNGINYPYSCLVGSQKLSASQRSESFSMNMSPYESKKNSYRNHEKNVELSLTDLVNYEGNYTYLPSTLPGWYCVKGRMEDIQVTEDGKIRGILTDGVSRALVYGNSFRANTIEEYGNATVFYLFEDFMQYGYDEPKYMVAFCE